MIALLFYERNYRVCLHVEIKYVDGLYFLLIIKFIGYKKMVFVVFVMWIVVCGFWGVRNGILKEKRWVENLFSILSYATFMLCSVR